MSAELDPGSSAAQARLMQFDHIGVVLKDIEEGKAFFSDLFGIRDWTAAGSDPINGVHYRFGRDDSGICYELLSPLNEHSPIALALKNGRAILNHVAYLVPDLEAARGRLRALGCVPAGEAKPAVAYGGRRIQFFISPHRFITELIEAPGHHHVYRTA